MASLEGQARYKRRSISECIHARWRSSQDNAYLLDQILRRYETGESLNRGVVSEQAAEIMALTSDAVTRAAVRYLDPARYVRVTLMPDVQ
jgi:predicted Zn-dependent peptidase